MKPNPLLIVDLIRRNGSKTIEEIAHSLLISTEQVIGCLIELVDCDLIIPIWMGNGWVAHSHWGKKWEINPHPKMTAFEDEEITLMRRKLRLGDLLNN